MSSSAYDAGLRHLARLITAAVERDRAGVSEHDEGADEGEDADLELAASGGMVPRARLSQNAEEAVR